MLYQGNSDVGITLAVALNNSGTFGNVLIPIGQVQDRSAEPVLSRTEGLTTRPAPTSIQPFIYKRLRRLQVHPAAKFGYL